MSNAQAERAISQLYESDSIRSELRDEEASLLMMWGEARLKELADHNLPEDQFDDLCAKFRSVLAAINILVGKRKTSPSQHLSMMASIGSAAEATGFVFSPDDQTVFLKQQNSMTNQDAISELLGLLKWTGISQPPPPVQQVAEAVTEVPSTTPAVEPPVSSQPIIESPAEIVMPQSAPEVTDHTLPPQPEELPEMPQQPPQEG